MRWQTCARGGEEEVDLFPTRYLGQLGWFTLAQLTIPFLFFFFYFAILKFSI
jgi:hypothetical protein